MSTTSYRLFWCYVAVMIGITAAAFGMFLEWEVMRVAGLVLVLGGVVRFVYIHAERWWRSLR